MKGLYLAILIAIVVLCMQPAYSAQVDGTDLGTFVVTAYNIANEADHPCDDTGKILAKGLNNYYCSEFLADIIMQGSGVDSNNNFIQIDWNGGKKPTTASSTFFTYVSYITTKSGQRLEDGVSIAVDPSVIPLNSWVYIESIGWRRADDTGGAIQGKRIDVFMNAPRKDAMNFGKKSLDVVLKANTQETGPQEPESTKQPTSVTLTLYVRDGRAAGPIIPGAQVTGQDSAGNSFEQTTDSNGYVTITGDAGPWSFTASADGYDTISWDQEITETDTKNAYLQESQPAAFAGASNIEPTQVALTLTVQGVDDDYNAEPQLSDAQVTGQDAAGNSFKGTTDSDGTVILNGQLGIWQFTISKEGYDTKSFNFDINEAYNPATTTCNFVTSLKKSATSESEPQEFVPCTIEGFLCGLNAEQRAAIAAMDPVKDKDAIAKMKDAFYTEIGHQLDSDNLVDLKRHLCAKPQDFSSCCDPGLEARGYIDCTNIQAK